METWLNVVFEAGAICAPLRSWFGFRNLCSINPH